MKLVISAGHEGGSCNVAVLSAVVWPGAITSFRVAAAQVWDPSSLPPPLFIPNRLGMPLLRVRVPSPPHPPRLFLQLLDGVPALEYCFEGWFVFFSFPLDRWEM